MTGASEYSERVVDALQSVGDRLANQLHFDETLTRPQDRIEAAALIVEIDQATLHSDVASLADDEVFCDYLDRVIAWASNPDGLNIEIPMADRRWKITKQQKAFERDALLLNEQGF